MGRAKGIGEGPLKGHPGIYLISSSARCCVLQRVCGAVTENYPSTLDWITSAAAELGRRPATRSQSEQSTAYT